MWQFASFFTHIQYSFCPTVDNPTIMLYEEDFKGDTPQSRSRDGRSADVRTPSDESGGEGPAPSVTPACLSPVALKAPRRHNPAPQPDVLPGTHRYLEDRDHPSLTSFTFLSFMDMSSAFRMMVRLLCLVAILGCTLPSAWGYPAATPHRRARREVSAAPKPRPAEKRQAPPRGSPGQLEESLHQLLQQASLSKPAKTAPKISAIRPKPVQPVSNIPPPSFQNLDLSYLLGPGAKDSAPQVAPPKYVSTPKTNPDLQDYLNLLSQYQLSGNAATSPNLLAANYPTTTGQADLLPPSAYPQNSYTADDYIEELEDAVSYIMNKLYQYQAMKQLDSQYADYYQLLREMPAPQTRGFDYDDYLDLLDPALYGDDPAYEQDSAAYRENEPANDDQESAKNETEGGDSEESNNAAGSGDESSASETEKTDNAAEKSKCAEGSDRKDCNKKDSDKADLISRLHKTRD
ncbi:hypothetical protein Bbelb_424210 [Branchiostoma belcheri]|nr:hypothetical protein Bbelb_424210 [Branchiostoma belcheri]